MCLSCVSHVLIMCRSCVGHEFVMCRSCVGHVLLSVLHYENVQDNIAPSG